MDTVRLQSITLYNTCGANEVCGRLRQKVADRAWIITLSPFRLRVPLPQRVTRLECGSTAGATFIVQWTAQTTARLPQKLVSDVYLSLHIIKQGAR